MVRAKLIAKTFLLALAGFSSLLSASQQSPGPLDVLDGDTLLIDGSPVHIAGIDAPELGPWAKCWAEAALAGHAREKLQTLLSDIDGRGWQLRDLSTPDTQGGRTARIVDREGFDIADDMTVYGYAALTTGRWNWCGENANLHSVEDGEESPHGPNLWWPAGHMFDPRASD